MPCDCLRGKRCGFSLHIKHIDPAKRGALACVGKRLCYLVMLLPRSSKLAHSIKPIHLRGLFKPIILRVLDNT